MWCSELRDEWYSTAISGSYEMPDSDPHIKITHVSAGLLQKLRDSENSSAKISIDSTIKGISQKSNSSTARDTACNPFITAIPDALGCGTHHRSICACCSNTRVSNTPIFCANSCDIKCRKDKQKGCTKAASSSTEAKI
jgi:hypothetical protein